MASDPTPTAEVSLTESFYGKTWMDWATLLFTLGAGVLGLALGLLMWSGNLRNIYDEPVTAGGPPATITGVFLLGWSALLIRRLIALRKPLICCTEAGVECRVVGAGLIAGLPLPGAIKFILMIWMN